MTVGEEFYGSPQSVAAMKRSAALWNVVRTDSRFAFYGRAVGLSAPTADTADVLGSLARLQGGAPCYFFPKPDADGLFAELESRGFATDRHEHHLGGEEAYAAARKVLTRHRLPADLTLRRLDDRTPGPFISEAVDLMESCEVMPVPAAYLRGQQGNGLCLVATDGEGRPAAVASSFFMHPAGSLYEKTVFWGMLATRPDRRGEKIALVLGALVIAQMWEEKGARGFMTGVRKDNASSQSLCNRLAVTDTDFVYAVCVDPETLGRKILTK